jgi:excisionase family DNA binding protein
VPLKDRNTVQDLAEFWRCSARTVQRRIASGDLVCFRSGSIVRITREQVEAFEAANTRDGTKGAAGLSVMDRDRLNGSALRKMIAGVPRSEALELGHDEAGKTLVERLAREAKRPGKPKRTPGR